MKVLVTGGAGFIGSNLSNYLIGKKYQVRVFDNLSSQIHGKDSDSSSLFKQLDKKVDFFKGDVRNREDWMAALTGCDAIIHLAAETGTGQSMYEIEKYIDVNTRGTSIMLDLLVNNKFPIRKVVVASSRAIYGEGKYNCADHGYVYPLARNEKSMRGGDFNVKCPICGRPADCFPTDEESAIHPTSVYGATKHEQERLTLMVCKSIGIPAVAFRYQNVYGPGQSLKNPYTGILSIFSTRLLNNNSIEVFEDGLESRDFVYIDDVVRATVLGLESEALAGKAINVGSGERTSVIEVVDKLRSALGKTETEYNITGNFRLGDIRHNFADINVLKSYGYSPQVPFSEGILRFADWVRTQEVETDNFEKSIREMKDKGLYK